MRVKLVILFIGSVLIPTALLSYFGLRAVRSEKKIVEQSIKGRYISMADIVESEIQRRLADMPDDMVDDTRYVESVMLGEASLFKDQVKIFDREGRDIEGARTFTADITTKESPVLTRTLKGLPYRLAVYETHPLILDKLEEKKKGLYLYIALIGSSALLIIWGGFFTLGALSREWHATELKSQFVSHLSHDLRRPLTSIRMFSEMLKEGRLPSEDKRKNYYDIITDESERLTHLANNILDFSRIERGRKKYDLKNENPGQVVRDTVNHFKAHLGEAERKINLSIDEGIPNIRIDGDAISQALMNLLTNAVKFSPQSGEINVNLKRGKREVLLEVIDQGVGISPRDQKKIFDKFYRSQKKEVAETDGSGLGLTLVKFIADAHKGHVRVDSREGKGSRFTMVLPV